jgi:hypothetical protein
MAGTQFVEITKDQVIANPLHFMANRQICVQLVGDTKFHFAEIIMVGKSDMEICIKADVFSIDGLSLPLYKANSILFLSLSVKGEAWRAVNEDNDLMLYGTSPD